jgi:hypothetical protein
VYNIYTDDVLEYNDAMALATETLQSQRVPTRDWPEELRPKRKPDSSVGDNSGGTIKRKTKEEITREAMEDLDPSLKAFLE